MAFEAITLEGKNVSAELDSCIYNAMLGFSGVLKFGNNLGYEIVTSNEIKIKDGLLINQGRFARINPGSTHSVPIRSGRAGVTRYDLIVAHFETDGALTETHEIRVIEGMANGPAPQATTGDVFKGAMINELPLYLVKLNGIYIESVTPKFTVYGSLFDMANRIKYGHGEPHDLNPGEIYIELE